MRRTISFNYLSKSDLYLDAIYSGGKTKNISADPIAKLLPVGNSGGFRYKGQVKRRNLPYVVLYSTLEDPNWPDNIDLETGVFTYFGDNRTAGAELHNTPKNGNKILSFSFELLHQSEEERKKKEHPAISYFYKGY